MFTPKCYRQMAKRMGYGSMFNESLQDALYRHQQTIEEIAGLLAEWKACGITQSRGKAVLVGLGYTETEVSDGLRLRRELDAAGVDELDQLLDEDGFPHPIEEPEFGLAPEAPAYGVVNSVS